MCRGVAPGKIAQTRFAIRGCRPNEPVAEIAEAVRAVNAAKGLNVEISA